MSGSATIHDVKVVVQFGKICRGDPCGRPQQGKHGGLPLRWHVVEIELHHYLTEIRVDEAQIFMDPAAVRASIEIEDDFCIRHCGNK
jgi:hypothetical protein